MYRIFPEPKSCCYREGSLTAGSFSLSFVSSAIEKSLSLAGCSLQELVKNVPTALDGSPIPLTVEETSCHPEGFSLFINSSGVQIRCQTGAGCFYAIGVLGQLCSQGNGVLPFLELSDEPALSVRGIMLDIGRDKIPSMDTLFGLMDLFASMRINHLQLYMEGFSFDYAQYHYLFTNETPLTPEEFQSLSRYAKARFIDLVPNQNVLGHMEKWLEKPQFRSLAECEEGYIFENLFWRPPMTLDAMDPKSFQFAVTLLDTLLEQSDSTYINVNMDEPFELGMGKNKAYAQANGRLSIYFAYMEKLHEYCTAKGKKMMMWGDEVLQHPEYVSRFPKDVILLDWIYEGDAHFESHAKLMQATGLSFCLCPGSSSWGTLTGRSENMAKNIRDAADCAIRYGGQGIVSTDWGDLGHWQYISVSYPAFAHAAFYSWSGVDADTSLIPWFLNRFLYESADGTAYQAAWDLGNYYHLEHAPLYNTTLAFAVMSSKYTFDSLEEFDAKIQRLLTLSANIAKTNQIPYKEPVIAIDYPAMDAYLNRVETEIRNASMLSREADLIRSEMINGLRMVRHGIRLYHTMKELRNDLPAFRKEMEYLFADLNEIMKIHYKLWSARNRQGGFQRSTAHMNHLLSFYRKMSREGLEN